MRQIVLIAHNIRSTHNVGSLLRTADGLGVQRVYLTGYTPYPLKAGDQRLPHIAHKLDRQITKVALGAQKAVPWSHSEKAEPVIRRLKRAGYELVSLEQSPDSVSLKSYSPPDRLALIVGEEVNGIEPDIIKMSDVIVEIPMSGKKESFNVAVAAAIGLSQLIL